jgi:hypothetical protein
MVRAERFLENAKSVLGERLGSGILPFCSIQPRKVIEGGGHFRIVRAERSLKDAESALGERLGSGILPFC